MEFELQPTRDTSRSQHKAEHTTSSGRGKTPGSGASKNRHHRSRRSPAKPTPEAHRPPPAAAAYIENAARQLQERLRAQLHLVEPVELPLHRTSGVVELPLRGRPPRMPTVERREPADASLPASVEPVVLPEHQVSFGEMPPSVAVSPVQPSVVETMASIADVPKTALLAAVPEKLNQLADTRLDHVTAPPDKPPEYGHMLERLQPAESLTAPESLALETPMAKYLSLENAVAPAAEARTQPAQSVSDLPPHLSSPNLTAEPSQHRSLIELWQQKIDDATMVADRKIRRLKQKFQRHDRLPANPRSATESSPPQPAGAPEPSITRGMEAFDMPLPAPPDRRVEQSAWHRIEIDKKTGRAVESPALTYGQEFARERQQEVYEEPAPAVIASGQLAVASAATIGGFTGDDTAFLPQTSANSARSLAGQLHENFSVRRRAPFAAAESQNFGFWLVALIIIILATIAIVI